MSTIVIIVWPSVALSPQRAPARTCEGDERARYCADESRRCLCLAGVSAPAGPPRVATHTRPKLAHHALHAWCCSAPAHSLRGRAGDCHRWQPAPPAAAAPGAAAPRSSSTGAGVGKLRCCHASLLDVWALNEWLAVISHGVCGQQCRRGRSRARMPPWATLPPKRTAQRPSRARRFCAVIPVHGILRSALSR